MEVSAQTSPTPRRRSNRARPANIGALNLASSAKLSCRVLRSSKNTTFRGKGARIDFVLACAYHDQGIGSLRLPTTSGANRIVVCYWKRNASSGLILHARSSSATRSPISRREWRLGSVAGLRRGALTLTGYGSSEAGKASRSNCAMAEPIDYQHTGGGECRDGNPFLP